MAFHYGTNERSDDMDLSLGPNFMEGDYFDPFLVSTVSAPASTALAAAPVSTVAPALFNKTTAGPMGPNKTISSSESMPLEGNSTLLTSVASSSSSSAPLAPHSNTRLNGELNQMDNFMTDLLFSYKFDEAHATSEGMAPGFSNTPQTFAHPLSGPSATTSVVSTSMADFPQSEPLEEYFTPLISPSVGPYDGNDSFSYGASNSRPMTGSTNTNSTGPSGPVSTQPMSQDFAMPASFFSPMPSPAIDTRPAFNSYMNPMSLPPAASPNATGMTPKLKSRKSTPSTTPTMGPVNPASGNKVAKPLSSMRSATLSNKRKIMAQSQILASHQSKDNTNNYNSVSSDSGTDRSSDSPVSMPPPPPKHRSLTEIGVVAEEDSIELASPSATPATPASLMNLGTDTSSSVLVNQGTDLALEHAIKATQNITQQQYHQQRHLQQQQQHSQQNELIPFQNQAPQQSQIQHNGYPNKSPFMVSPSIGPNSSINSHARSHSRSNSTSLTRRTSGPSVSPAIAPKISPKILPYSNNQQSHHQSMGHNHLPGQDYSTYLAQNSNYQTIMDGKHNQFGLNYPPSLNINLVSKRTNHKLAEQGRRNRINAALAELARLLPASPSQPAAGSKASTVELAIEYIQRIKGDNEALRHRVSWLEERERSTNMEKKSHQGSASQENESHHISPNAGPESSNKIFSSVAPSSSLSPTGSPTDKCVSEPPVQTLLVQKTILETNKSEGDEMDLVLEPESSGKDKTMGNNIKEAEDKEPQREPKE